MTRKGVPDRDHAALLVIDMQEYFRAMAKPVIDELSRVIERARSVAVPVIYTQHGHADPERDAGMLGQWWGDVIIEGSPDWAILPELAPQAGERVVAKRRYNAFHDTDLDAHLRSSGVEDLVISGVMTNLCCETTARDAFVRDFRVFFLTDGTATASAAMHRATLLNLDYGFATLMTCQELRSAL